MSESSEFPDILQEIEDYIYEKVPKTKTGRMAHIGVLRKTDSYNIFTTEGSELNLASTSKKPESEEKIQRIVMFKRKQVASERRKGKEILRGLYKNNSDDIEKEEAFGNFNEDEDLCRLHDNLGGKCIDCKLYGFANAEEKDGSRHSRILTDSAFSVRGLNQREDITFNAQSEENESEASTALNSTAHTQPETFFPSIVTIRDFTWRELYWLIHLIESTTRYGAETSRTGYIDNQIVSIWFDTKETISNLELTKEVTKEIENNNGSLNDLSVQTVRKAMKETLPNSKVDIDDIKDDIKSRFESNEINFLEKLYGSQLRD
ncbi:MAG: CRISPR-Cas system related protein, RAMP superfamily Cas7 group [Candidatus Methanohalarchaeum thermophilum]|uniref:CRISPR-Cas system related protein, RAMP superfamily Cas7 group n=1 Tax=Methanohalarchaeum thermophilum TaxID=1903181 RepID=A0A1Q6DWQ9_METT1|nr:MAG: CRISPR-Cas system related protein, RAMP superfamily Cas7 group [Candidatus Methanohalarchaeum thermophilum]